jgi:hypothetical protein
MGFTRRFPWLIALPLLAFSGVLFLPLGLWYWLAYPPVQRYYLGAYFESALMDRYPSSTVELQWLYKTASHRKRELATDGDVVSDSAGNNFRIPMKLSPAAHDAGWTGLIQGRDEPFLAAELAPYLQKQFFAGESVGRLLLKPLLWGLAAIFFLLAGRAMLPRLSQYEQRHGRRTKGPELRPAFAWLRNRKADGIRFQLRFENPLLRWLPFGPSYRIPRRLESSHILLMGDTGSGKSTAIRQILCQVQKRGESAIVYDPAMDFVSEFYDPKRGDLILNPLDARCPYWSLGKEIDREETATTIAAAFLPEKEYEKAFFTDGPRRILAHLLKRKPQPRDILKWMADPDHMAAMVKGTPLAALLDPAAPAQRAGVLASLNMVADCLELLPEWEHTKATFDTAEWYTERKRWVFLTSQSAYREKLLPLHSVWLDLFILRMMGYCEDRQAKPVWFVLDELASLNKLPQLHTAVTENRKYGNPVVLGFQGRSQLEKRYGQDAEAMLSQPVTKVFLKTSEPRAAKWISDAIGEVEVERLKESRSMGLLRSKKSYAMEIATKPLIMASEISGLEPLHGFVKQENRVVLVRFTLTKKRRKLPDFIAREMHAVAPRPVLPGPAAAPEGPTKKPAASHAALPFSDPPVAKPKKEAFVWDESKGID